MEAADPSFKMATIPEPPSSAETSPPPAAEESGQPDSPGNGSPEGAGDAAAAATGEVMSDEGVGRDAGTVSPAPSDDDGQSSGVESPPRHAGCAAGLLDSFDSPETFTADGEAEDEFEADIFHFSPRMLTPYSN